MTWAVLLAGGHGTRLWPRSRRSLPKQCLPLAGTRTLLQATLDRVRDLIPPERVLVCTGRDMEAAVRAQLPEVAPDRFLVEPRPRGTAPALAWANEEVTRRGGEDLVVLPTDHHVEDGLAFRRALVALTEAARGGVAGADGPIAVLGVPAGGPEIGFGYLVPADPLPGDDAGDLGQALRARRVARFVEKPDPHEAAALVDLGACWSAGVFAWRPTAFRRALARHLPRTAAVADRLREGVDPAEAWDDTDAISVDHGVLERHQPLAVVCCDVGWSDLGTWSALRALLPEGPLGRARVRAGVAVGGGGHLVDAPDHLVVTIGVSDLVIVASDGVLLVCTAEEAGRVPEVVATLRRDGLGRFT